MTPRVKWWPEAEDDLLNLRSWRDGAWICSEVERYAALGVGDVRQFSIGSVRSVYGLFLPGYRVVFTVDRTSRTIHIWAVLRGIRPG